MKTLSYLKNKSENSPSLRLVKAWNCYKNSWNMQWCQIAMLMCFTRSWRWKRRSGT